MVHATPVGAATRSLSLSSNRKQLIRKDLLVQAVPDTAAIVEKLFHFQDAAVPICTPVVAYPEVAEDKQWW